MQLTEFESEIHFTARLRGIYSFRSILHNKNFSLVISAVCIWCRMNVSFLTCVTFLGAHLSR